MLLALSRFSRSNSTSQTGNGEVRNCEGDILVSSALDGGSLEKSQEFFFLQSAFVASVLLIIQEYFYCQLLKLALD